MTGAELRTLRMTEGLTQQASADLVHVHLTTWQRMESGKIPVAAGALELYLMKVESTKDLQGAN